VFSSGLRQPSYHDVNHGDAYPCLAALARLFIIAAQPAELHQPGKGALYHPAARQHDKASGTSTTLDDLQRPTRKGGYPANQLTRIAPVRPQQAQSRKLARQPFAHQLGPVPILNARTMNHDHEQQAQRVYGDVTFAPLDFLARVVAVAPPFCVVLTDCESRIAALGVGSLPTC
jgi:hypothetical protein